VPVWVGHLLLALAVCSLGAAAVRVASLAAPRGLARVLAAAPLGVAAAVVEALALGLVGWGGSPVALTLAAVVTWAVVRVLAPRPQWRLRDDLLDAWRPLHREWRMVAGAIAGIAVAYLAFLLRYPELGFDGIVYHLPEIVAWVQGGQPGSVVTTIQGLPVGAYPVTDEVAIAWATGIARSMVPVTLFTPLTLVLLLTAGWAGLRALRAPRWATALALAALAVQPLVIAQLTGPNTDLPALAWLACEAALCALAVAARPPGSGTPAPAGQEVEPTPATVEVVEVEPAPATVEVVEAKEDLAQLYRGARVPPGAGGAPPQPPPRALLLAPALVALFLAVGTKTTVAPLALIVLGATAWALRRELRPVLAPLAGALALGVLAGGLWYLRNLLDHGSPLWPFVNAPWGDPNPPLIDAASPSFLERPSATLSGRLGDYADLVAGGLVLLIGGLLAAFANRRAAVAAGATALSVVLWALAPVTGASRDPAFVGIAISALRYLLPALAAGAAALALAAGEERGAERRAAADTGAGEAGGGERARRRGFAIGAGAVLALALGWGLVRDAQIGFPVTPSATTLVAGAVIGALTAWLAGWLLVRIPLAATAIVVALVLVIPASGYLERHAEASRSFDPDLSRFMAAQSNFGDDHRPVAMAPILAGPLAGDRLTHRLTLLRDDAPCAQVRRAARDGYVVLRALSSVEVRASPRVVFPVPVTARRCLAPARPVFSRGGVEVYALR
jgi:hypothetical protein